MIDQMTSLFDIERNRIVEASGAPVEPELVTVLRGDWEKYMQEGIIVDISVHRWRAESSLSVTDIGIGDKEMSKLLKLGTKRLLPVILPESTYYSDKTPERTYSDVLDSLESGARGFYKKKTISYSTPWGYFVPVGNFKECVDGLKEYETKWYAIRDEIAGSDERYQEIVTALLNEYAQQAAKAWITAKRLDEDKLRERDWLELDQFVAAYLIRIRRLLPSRVDFVASFNFEIKMTYIPLPAMMAAEQAKAQEIAAQAEIVRQRYNQKITLQYQINRAESDVVEAERRAAMSAAEMKELQLREMNAQIVAQAKAQAQGWIEQFVGNIAEQIYDLFDEVTTNAIDSIDGNGKLIGKTAGALRNMIDTIKKMDPTDSVEIGKMLAPVESALAEPSGARNIVALQQKLTDLRIVSRSALFQIADQRGARGEVNLKFTEPDFTAVRQARTNLNLDTATEHKFSAVAVRQERIAINMERMSS